MATLIPRNGRYLDPMDVIMRMQAEFAYVESSAEGALSQVLTLIDQLAFVAEGGRTAAVEQYVVELERFRDAARLVHFGDDLGRDGVLLSMLIIPHQPLIIEAQGQDEETWFLIFRAAGVLEYEVFEPESVEMEAGADAYAAGAHVAAA